MLKTVRTRFAPSPTGYMHIGNLRTALYEYLIARSSGGKFILRIEDTDQKRYVGGSVDIIYNTLKMAGLKHDEGPDIGGAHGPYVQSQRKDIYLPYAKKLVETGHAYYCFCSRERLEEYGKAAAADGSSSHISPGYDRHCRNLSPDVVKSSLDAGMPFVIRQKMPFQGSTSFEDMVYGTITIPNVELDDQILVKSDGLPTYNFANVIDDHLMEITHVVRGSEYLTSTPKYKLLYEAFGWSVPVYVHLPLITKPGGDKMSKRAGDPSFEDLASMGFLVEAVVNYVALLGWSPGDEREFFTLEELEKSFNIEGISKSPAVFDIEKLKWMNSEYIRRMDPGKFHKIASVYYEGLGDNIDKRKLSGVLQQRTVLLPDILSNIGFLKELPDHGISLYTHVKMKTDPNSSLPALKSALNELEKVREWNSDALHETLITLASTLGIKNGQLLWPVRVALTGLPVSPGGAVEIACILGRDESLRRIRKGIAKLENAGTQNIPV